MEEVFKDLVIVKRSGQRVAFNGTKIAVAIKNAFDDVSLNNEDKANVVYLKVLDNIKTNYSDRKTITVEDIQDIIEKVLKESNHIDEYNAFNEYRVKRKASRDLFDQKQQHKFVKATEKLVLAANNNNNEVPMDLLFNFGKTISNEFSKAYLIDSKYVRAHNDGAIYIHDLDYYVLGTTGSCHVDLSNVKENNYFEDIISVLLNFKKEQHAEHTITSLDYLVIPYMINKFKSIFMNNIKVSFELEGFSEYINIKSIEYTINKYSTIYINYNDFEKYLLNEKISNLFNKIYDYSINELKEDLHYNIKKLLITLNDFEFSINSNSGYSISIGTNTSKEGKIINEIYFNVISELDYLDKVTTIFKYTSKSDLDNISKLICMNKNISISNGCSYNTSKNNDYKGEVEYFKTGEKILDNVYERYNTSVGRMIVSKVSINLARIALITNNIDDFYKELDNTLELSKNELLQSFEYISNKNKESYDYIFKDNYLIDSEKLEDNQKIKKVIRNGTLNIKYASLDECVKLLNKDNSYKVDIVKYIKNKCDEFTNENKLNFSLSPTYENKILDYFNALDKAIYGSRVSNNYYYKNTDLKIEALLHKYSNGGYMTIIDIPKNYSYKKLNDILLDTLKKDIGFIKVRIGYKL